jgi:hypothetical protein
VYVYVREREAKNGLLVAVARERGRLRAGDDNRPPATTSNNNNNNNNTLTLKRNLPLSTICSVDSRRAKRRAGVSILPLVVVIVVVPHPHIRPP